MAGGGRPLVIPWAAEDEAPRLKGLYQAERRRDVRPRLHALWLLRSGRRIREVAAVLGVHERNLQRWVGWYRAGGLAAVMAHRRQGPGKVAWLSTEQQAAVVAQSATGAFRTAAEVRPWVAETFGVTYTEGGMYALLARLRVHPKVPRPVTPKVDPAEQDAWEKGA
jgi:transposase